MSTKLSWEATAKYFPSGMEGEKRWRGKGKEEEEGRRRGGGRRRKGGGGGVGGGRRGGKRRRELTQMDTSAATQITYLVKT